MFGLSSIMKVLGEIPPLRPAAVWHIICPRGMGTLAQSFRWDPSKVHFQFPLPESEQRFRELLLYICEKCATDPKFGATKLNKILYFSDFLAFARLGQPITGFEYQRERNGPVPKRLVPIRNEMLRTGDLAVQPVKLANGRVQQRSVNLREPRLDIFTPQQIALVDSIIEAFRGFTADEVSDFSHQMVGWKIANTGESIPYETVFVSAEPLTDADIQRAQELAKAYPEYGRA